MARLRHLQAVLSAPLLGFSGLGAEDSPTSTRLQRGSGGVDTSLDNRTAPSGSLTRSALVPRIRKDAVRIRRWRRAVRECKMEDSFSRKNMKSRRKSTPRVNRIPNAV